MKKIFNSTLLLTCSALITGPALAASDLPPYTPVTTEDLANPNPSNWMQYRGDYSGWGFSPLKQINADNVSDLELAWSYTTGEKEGHQAPPVVKDGYMYITTPGNRLIALNAVTGREIWSYQHKVPKEMMQLHPTNRGVALYGKNVYMATLDCKLVALDAETGKVQWEAKNGEWKEGYYGTLAPLAAKGKVMMGCSGGEFGIRGSVGAFNAETGKEEWRTYTVAGPDDPGGDTWPGDTYKRGGGGAWITGSYDPDTNLTYWGVGNPGPWNHSLRKGDNLYTNSVIALDVDSGDMKAYHQYSQNDAWDWDEVSTPLLIETEIDGKKTKTVVHAARNGYLWQLDGSKGKQLGFMNAWAYSNNNVFKSIDQKTGRPTYNTKHRPSLERGARFCPSLWGGKDWVPEAYNPDTKLLYIPANNNMCSWLPKGETDRYTAGGLYIGYPLSGILTTIRLPEGPDHIGELQAWDLSKGEMVWKHEFPSFLWGPLLTTAGDLVFGGGTSDRMFRAFNAKTGKVLWKFPAPSGVIGVPTSFEIDGTQYIAVQSGWGVDAQRVQGALDYINETETVVPQGGTLLVFKLGANKRPQLAHKQ